MNPHQIVTERFACLIELNDDFVIVTTAPLLRTFEGQPLRNLIRWCKRNFKQVYLFNLAAP